MKDYKEMAESVLRRREQYVRQKKKQRRQLTAVISCLCLCALIGAGQSGIFSRAAAKPGSAAVSPQTPAAAVPPQQPAIVSDGEHSAGHDKVISVAGAPLAPPVTALTQDALYDAIGDLLPDKAPDGFLLESASLSEYCYSVIWYHGLEELNWRIRDYTDADASRITAVADTENYDLALYPIPRADSVPDALREIVDHPIFLAEELTPEVVYARAYKVEDAGDSNGCRMQFSVLYGEKLISVTSKGVSPDWLYEQLSRCGRI